MMILPVNPLKTDVKQNYRSSYIKSIEKYLDIGIISTQRQNSQHIRAESCFTSGL